MATETGIYNNVLDILGENIIGSGETIDTTNQPRITVIARNWDQALDEFLREYPWNWAKKFDALEEVSPVPDFGWTHRFTMPDDFVTLLSLNEDDAYDQADYCEIAGPYLYTDEDTAVIEYIARPTDGSGSGIDANWITSAVLGRMDPLAVNAFQTLLASKCANKLIKDGMATANNLMSQYLQRDLPRARHRNATEQKMPALFPKYSRSNWLAARQASTADG